MELSIRSKVFTLPLFYNDTLIENSAGITTGYFSSIDKAATEFLSSQEQIYFKSFKQDTPRLHYLLGRHSAKRALIECDARESDFTKISIDTGVWGQPLLTSSPYLDVSITHANRHGIGLIYAKQYPMGIDIVGIDLHDIDVLKTMTSIKELTDIPSSELEGLTIAWSLKEALSKALRCGLTVPLHILQMQNFKFTDDIFECEFCNFPQYKGIAWILGRNTIGIVYPVQLSTNTLMLNNTINSLKYHFST